MQDAMHVGESDGTWQAAHHALVDLAKERAGMDFEEGCWLLAARRAGVHGQLGYGSFVEYVGRLFGYTPRVTHDKLRVAQALERLPELSRHLSEGSLTFSHVRELTRVATPETEKAWLDRARGCTLRQVEKLVSGRRPGALPDSPVETALERHVLRFEVTGETLASFREALAKLRRDSGKHLDDDAVLLLVARHVLGGPIDDGRASYQFALDLCSECQRMRQLADGEPVEVSPAAAEMAQCDAQWLARTRVGTSSAGASSDGSANAQVEGAANATQDVAPAVRRAVLRRDHHRCQVPGCSHATWVDIHHIDTRADGGTHDANNLLTLCGAHHRAIHEGILSVSKAVNGDPAFFHADGTQYGDLPSAPVALLHAKAFRALRGLGFGERDARSVLSRAEQSLTPDANLEILVRRCLEFLTERASTKAS